MLPGLCIDLETTIAGRIPDHVRPPGQKRYETRIIEIGAVLWHAPKFTFSCLVNPLPKSKRFDSVQDFKNELRQMHQKPDSTIDFWSRVLVKRRSLNKSILNMAPSTWLKLSTERRCEDFMKWHNNPKYGPSFLSEREGFEKLCAFSEKHSTNVWYAHNGASFDFKILIGCALRKGLPMPKTTLIDTLRLFRRKKPNLSSYSQPILYKTIFKTTYNAHVAIDDAKALAKLCQWADTLCINDHPRQTRLVRQYPREKPQKTPRSKRVSKTKKSFETKDRGRMKLVFKKQTKRQVRRLAMKLVFRAIRKT